MVGRAKAELRKSLVEKLSNIRSSEDIFDLFKFLNYPENVSFDTSFKRKKSSFDFKKEDSERIKQIYPILSFGKKINKGDKLPVFLIESKTLNSTFIRNVTKKFSDMYLRSLLIFTVDYDEIAFVFPDFEKREAGKHKLKITKLIVKLDDIYYTDVETLANIYFENREETWRDVWRKWKEAFNVEKVTKKFFEDYKNLFFKFRNKFNEQGVSRKQSHEFTLQFLNRLMFVYFISKKGWLENKKFMKWFWRTYKVKRNEGNTEENSFYEKWLKQLFFKAFNNRNGEISDLPEEVIQSLSNFPFLNGGLFTENEYDELPMEITDDDFNDIFNFFESYNFTIKEDAALDVEVSVDPQMIGYVYESLAQVADEIYDRNDMGIFYTPKIEVHFMCGRSLVEYLSKHLPKIPKEKFYHLIFSFPEEREKIEKYFEKNNLWDDLEDCLDDLSVVDPACGSGNFLVGMLNILAELYHLIYKYRKNSLTDYELKKRIAGKSIYGVDVMPWAIHAAELRIWLQLIVETSFNKEELRTHPLLPNLNMNLRIGDSLVQEIEGMNLHLRDSNISIRLRKKLLNLKEEKEKYFNSEPTAKFKDHEELRKEEIRIFEEVINDKIDSLDGRKKSLKSDIIKLGKTKQKNLFGEISEEKQKKIINQKQEKEKYSRELEKNINELTKIQKELNNPEKKPFIWDIDFAEVFGDKNGFDIVIGNPPYVRQEKISPSNRIKSEVTLEERREYKDKLSESVKAHIPVVNKINKQSDYYIYFYFHGLSILNEKGTFCFITSNSWLDVNFGKELQEFLLKYVPIIGIYDSPIRSFEHADINTVISLFNAPKYSKDKDWWRRSNGEWTSIDNIARFVMFKKPFEEVLSPKNLIEIEEAVVKTRGEKLTDLIENVVKTNEYRIFPIIQEDLLDDGWEYPESYDKSIKGKFKRGSYNANKWGAKYLRAPDIYYKILEKGKDKLVKLGKIANIRFGLKTGSNKFFYLDSERLKQWSIEKQFIQPIIKSPRECESIIIDPNMLKYNLFLCHKKKEDLENTRALEYIQWGESKNIHKKPSVKYRKRWYDVGERDIGQALCMMSYNNRHIFWKNDKLLADARFYDIYSEVPTNLLTSCLNSTLTFLSVELNGRVNLGEGALDFKVYEAEDIILVNPKLVNFEKIEGAFQSLSERPIGSVFQECGLNPDKPILEQKANPKDDRKSIDDIIFDILELTKSEREEVYLAVCNLIRNRLEKAKSFKEK